MELKFLGDGSTFDYVRDNTAAYITNGDTLYLFDCGQKICAKILYHNLLDKINNVIVFITHLHADHVGSLEALISYVHYYTNKSIKVFYPEKDRLNTFLNIVGLNYDIGVCNDFDSLEGIKVEYIKQIHIEGSYGYFFYSSFASFYYSGDTSVIQPRAIEELYNGKLDNIYHEVSLDENSSYHTHVNDLANMIASEYRNKVITMHYKTDEVKNRAIELGFSCCMVVV